MLVGSAMANRQTREDEDLIGMFVNTVPLRVRVDPMDAVVTMLNRISATVLNAVDHQEAPFAAVVQAVGVPRDSSRNPLVQHCFSFHDSPVPPIVLPGATGKLVELGNGTAKFDLNVIVVPRGEQLIGRTGAEEAEPLVMVWEYGLDLFDDADIAELAASYRTVLLEMMRNPHDTIRSWLGADPNPEAKVVVPEPVVPRSYRQAGAIGALLANVSSSLLGHRVTPDANFFSAGGHSLLAMRMVSQLRHKHGLPITVQDVFDKPRLATLAEALDKRMSDNI
jgi:non-ribosomal peptide synthetase component F